MPRFRIAVLARHACAVTLAGFMACAQAAELGTPVVRSHIGQPLIADIELTHLADVSVAVVVRPAHPDVYKGANIAMHPVLSNLNMSVMRRDGRQFLHITSTKEVDSQYVHLFLELIEGNKRNIRTETLWLTPDPTPAPPPPPPVTVPEPVAAVAPPVAQPVARPAPPAPRVLKLPRSSAAAATCPSAEQVKACAVTGYKNGLLSAQIVELEEKVRALELAMKGGTPAAAPVPNATAKPAAKGAPPSLAPKVARKKTDGFPWLLAAGIVAALAALGGAVFFFLRRRKAAANGAGAEAAETGETAETAAAESAAWYARLVARFRRTPKDAAPVEPELPKEG